jgi:hypothetical protein
MSSLDHLVLALSPPCSATRGGGRTGELVWPRGCPEGEPAPHVSCTGWERIGVRRGSSGAWYGGARERQHDPGALHREATTAMPSVQPTQQSAHPEFSSRKQFVVERSIATPTPHLSPSVSVDHRSKRSI